MLWKYFLTAIALMLVIEGIMPFLSPRRWRNMMFRLSTCNDKTLRLMGLCSMLSGVLITYLVHSGILSR